MYMGALVGKSSSASSMRPTDTPASAWNTGALERHSGLTQQKCPLCGAGDMSAV